MTHDVHVWIAIIGMTVGTYLTRVAGLWTMRRVDPPPFVRDCLRHAPGSILTALIVPAVLALGLNGILATAVVVAVFIWRGGFALPMAGGVLAIYLLRLA